MSHCLKTKEKQPSTEKSWGGAILKEKIYKVSPRPGELSKCLNEAREKSKECEEENIIDERQPGYQP